MTIWTNTVKRTKQVAARGQRDASENLKQCLQSTVGGALTALTPYGIKSVMTSSVENEDPIFQSEGLICKRKSLVLGLWKKWLLEIFKSFEQICAHESSPIKNPNVRYRRREKSTVTPRAADWKRQCKCTAYLRWSDLLCGISEGMQPNHLLKFRK